MAENILVYQEKRERNDHFDDECREAVMQRNEVQNKLL